MTDDLLSRLHKGIEQCRGRPANDLLREAADAIERLTRENAELRNCLDGGYDCAGERQRLRAALREAVAYITMDSEHPPMLEEWRALALAGAPEETNGG